MKPRFISRTQASQFISLSIRQIDRIIRDGKIKAFKPHNSRRVLIDPESINQENLQAIKPKYNNFYTLK